MHDSTMYTDIPVQKADLADCHNVGAGVRLLHTIVLLSNTNKWPIPALISTQSEIHNIIAIIMTIKK
jgi:hypothetical protein